MLTQSQNTINIFSIEGKITKSFYANTITDHNKQNI